MRRMTILLLMLLGFVELASMASAAVVIGGSALLDGVKANHLESWLGPNSITLTSIFSKSVGDGKSSVDFHAAVDGKGPTFTVIEVLAGGNVAHQIIGGYNPQSWNSSGAYNYTYADGERTGFIFNLTSTERQGQKPSTYVHNILNENGQLDDYGSFQTYNWIDVGPTFGVGFDLHIDGVDLSSGYALNATYGNGLFTDNIIAGAPAGFTGFDVGRIEVFAVAQAAAVPEPASLAIWTLLGLTIGGAHWLRRRKN